MKTIATLAVVAVLLGPGLSVAQDAEKPSENAKLAATSAPKNAIAVKLHVTVSKYQSEKKVSSVPFTVSLTDNNIWNRIRAGARVPIPMATMTPNATGPTHITTSKSVSASTAERSRYQTALFRSK